MSGPTYPAGPLPGSNGIGFFTIGVSPIGQLADFDIWQTIISQYANSDILTRLIENLFEYIDQTRNIESFFDLIFNLDTAEGEGLGYWGRIVGVNRVLQVPSGEYFGFDEALPGSYGFNQAPYFGGTSLTSNYRLSDQAYRTLIFAKAAANITDGSIASINAILMYLFPNRGNAYVAEGYRGDPYFGFNESGTATGFNQGPFYAGASVPSMSMSYVFTFPLTPVELSIVQSSGVLPKPTGVSASIVLL